MPLCLCALSVISYRLSVPFRAFVPLCLRASVPSLLCALCAVYQLSVVSYHQVISSLSSHLCAFVPLCLSSPLCAFVPLCLCAFLPPSLCLCAFVPQLSVLSGSAFVPLCLCAFQCLPLCLCASLRAFVPFPLCQCLISAFVPLCLCASLPLCLCAFVPLCLPSAFVPHWPKEWIRTIYYSEMC